MCRTWQSSVFLVGGAAWQSGVQGHREGYLRENTGTGRAGRHPPCDTLALSGDTVQLIPMSQSPWTQADSREHVKGESPCGLSLSRRDHITEPCKKQE